MLARERYQKILHQLSKTGTVTTTELIALLNVSIETVRRDLLHLERSGQLHRVHGGAMANGSMQPYADLPHRLEANPSGKAELCHTASRLVEDNDIIFIDSGSTAVFFAQALLSRDIRLTVVTHSKDVFDILSVSDRFRLILCGGFYDHAEKAFYGQLALDSLKRLHVKKAFLCPTAISLKSGIWDYNDALIQVQAQAIASSEKVIFLADSEKFEKNAMLKLCDTSAAHTYVSDSQFPQHYKQLYEEQGISVITSTMDIASGKGLSNESR
jgi:DeoR/GlpR family transcriptional regulator of sugar metabolism